MKPILFNADMVRAILEGRKTQTRRVVKPDPEIADSFIIRDDGTISACHVDPPCFPGDTGGVDYDEIRCPYGQPGDRLWVRETFANIGLKGYPPTWFYRADGDELPPFDGRCEDNKWRPSIHMPRAASRIDLEITAVRVERVQDISVEDALDEGIVHSTLNCPRMEFAQLWNKINGPDAWDQNPWVWVIEFERVR